MAYLVGLAKALGLAALVWVVLAAIRVLWGLPGAPDLERVTWAMLFALATIYFTEQHRRNSEDRRP